MISLISLLNHNYVKVPFRILLMVWLKKASIYIMKKYFNKELLMTKKDDDNFENSSKCWVCDHGYIDYDVKERDHCQITGKYRGSAHRDCNINVKLNHKIPVVSQNLKSCDSHLIKEN